MDKEAIFRNAVAALGEHFTDYVVIVKEPRGLVWKMSDRTFALGAVSRLQIRLETEEQFQVRESIIPEEGGQ